MLSLGKMIRTIERDSTPTTGGLLPSQSFQNHLPPFWRERPHQAEHQLVRGLGRGAEGVGERQGGHPAVATLCIGALAVEIRDIIAQSVGLGNAAPLATHFAINPHYAPFSIQINSLSCHSEYCFFYTTRLIFSRKSARRETGVPRC